MGLNSLLGYNTSLHDARIPNVFQRVSVIEINMPITDAKELVFMQGNALCINPKSAKYILDI